MTPKMTAGNRLRRDLDAALAAAGKELGTRLEWDEREADVIGRAAATADRLEVLRAAFDAESAGGADPAVLVKLSAELRALDRLVVDLVARVNPGVGPAKSQRHIRAARSRWERNHG
ncbi:hypothetical protein BHQ15_17835 [Mycolicibacillus koreensis]|nr:hypothetical protein BHQ15_17835 [Mycolicibacillus koreensis]